MEFHPLPSDLRQPARANEVSENILLFDDRRQLMDVETSRRADDEIVVDEVREGGREELGVLF